MFDCSGNEQPGLYEISRKPPKPTSAGALTADQQMMLNQIKKRAALGKAGPTEACRKPSKIFGRSPLPIKRATPS